MKNLEAKPILTAEELNNLEAINKWSNAYTNILLLDDDPSMISLLKKNLENIDNGHVYSFSDESEAIRSTYDIRYDLCIIDIALTHTNGFVIGEVIRSMNYNKVPIVYISKDQDYLIDFYNHDQTNTFFYPKPIQKKDFLEIITNMLELQQR